MITIPPSMPVSAESEKKDLLSSSRFHPT